MARYVKVSNARAQLTRLMVLAENELEWVILTRHGKPVASLVSHAQMMRIFDDENIDLFGPVNPETGRQMGAAWVKRTGWVRGEGSAGPNANPILGEIGEIDSIQEDGHIGWLRHILHFIVKYKQHAPLYSSTAKDYKVRD